MNVTTSAGWTRPPVGIVRVELELCRELRALYGQRFSTCVFKDGKFVPEDEQGKDVFWPDVLEDFPSFNALDGVTDNDTLDGTLVEAEESLSKAIPNIPFHPGDVLITVGLDWEWDKVGLTNCLIDLKKQRGMHIVTCCYDLIPILFPQYCVGDVAGNFKQYYNNLTWSSSLMLCISEQTQSDYRRLSNDLGFPQIPSMVFPLGNNLPDDSTLASAGKQVSEIIKEPYILFVSTIERRKNHEVLYRAFHLLCSAGNRDVMPKLVFVGMAGWGVGDLLKDIELDPQTKDLIVQLNHVSDLELKLLYENCMLFAYPSLYEGWGLPVAEALSYGRPVFASSCGSIPEVGGELVDYIDPWSAASWADAILNAIENPDELERKANRIKTEYEPRSWTRSAEVVKSAVDQLVSQEKMVTRFEPGYDFSSFCGVPYGGSLVSTGSGGILSFGPYISLPIGKFSVELFFRTQDGSLGNVSVKLTCQKGESVFIEQVVEVSQLDSREFSMKIDFEVENPIDDFEIVTAVQDGVKIKFDHVILEKISL